MTMAAALYFIVECGLRHLMAREESVERNYEAAVLKLYRELAEKGM